MRSAQSRLDQGKLRSRNGQKLAGSKGQGGGFSIAGTALVFAEWEGP